MLRGGWEVVDRIQKSEISYFVSNNFHFALYGSWLDSPFDVYFDLGLILSSHASSRKVLINNGECEARELSIYSANWRPLIHLTV